jgi:PhzF family phenazine biosynthesis protein
VTIPIFHVDAFAEEPFEGNPAAVCLLGEERPESWMQAVASELNLSAIAFVRQMDRGYELRWFTPAAEIALCGHGTLAAAHVMWAENVVERAEPLRFHTKSGILTCEHTGDIIELNFPAIAPTEGVPPSGLFDALHVRPSFAGKSRFDHFVMVESEEIVRALKPDFHALRSIPGIRGVIVTSTSHDPRYDFVSRFFAPGVGIDEDPVTGSAHCSLAPFWSERLAKSAMTALCGNLRVDPELIVETLHQLQARLEVPRQLAEYLVLLIGPRECRVGAGLAVVVA